MNRDPNRLSLTEPPLMGIRTVPTNYSSSMFSDIFLLPACYRDALHKASRNSLVVSLLIIPKIRAAFVTRCFQHLETQL